VRITKFVHSCLLVEHDGKKALVDPGNYSWNSGLIGQDLLHDIDYVCITHIHPDHLDPTFANVVNELSPNALWYSTQEVCTQLKGSQIEAHSDSQLSDVLMIKSDHANLDPWFPEQPEHTSFLLFEELPVSGDHQSHASNEGARILAGAFNGGPWGAAVGSVAMIRDMKPRPKVYIPLHDWHLKDEAREALYERAKVVCEGFGVEFLSIKNGYPVEV
jgi:L-ascorbate metabolism protein UlaG (beta-lactamase superfamily)